MGDSFKSGSGNLDFGSDEDESEDEVTEASAKEDVEAEPVGDTATSRSETETQSVSSSQGSSTGDTVGQDTEHKYPYFVRRSKVGDERDNRLEVFARDEVVSQESKFRSELANQLGADSVTKTDAREYALLTAFENVEEVAERMREDGYGELE